MIFETAMILMLLHDDDDDSKWFLIDDQISDAELRCINLIESVGH